MSVIQEIADERKKQIEIKGYSPEHDDEHTDCSIAMAAACYGAPEDIFVNDPGGSMFSHQCDAWPWNKRYDNKEKHSYRERLIISAALLVAEIERLDRIITK